MSTGMILSGIACSAALDSSGEVIDIAGLDVTEFDEGRGTINYGHQSEKTGNGEEVVGKVTYCHKVFGESDCEDDEQRRYWKDLGLPFLYIRVRLFDGAGHSGAKALAASIRDQVANNEKCVLRWSIEGSTLKKEGNVLKKCVARAVALTNRPANRSCATNLLLDPNAPDGFDKVPGNKKNPIFDAEKSEFINPLYMPLGSHEHEIGAEDLEKAMSAGTGVGTAAPSTLLGGAALQTVGGKNKQKAMVNQAVSAMTKFGAHKNFNKLAFKSFMKVQLPEASEAFLDHFSDMVEDVHIKRGTLKKDEDGISPLVKLEVLSVELNKVMANLRSAEVTHPLVPNVHAVTANVGGKQRQVGRFMILDGHVHILEDYHGILSRFVPEGTMSYQTIARLHALKQSPDLTIYRDHPGMDLSTEPKAPALPSTPVKRYRPSVWDYHRAGMEKPHVLEVQNGAYMLDGSQLSYSEVSTVITNLRSGAAKLRYIEGNGLKNGNNVTDSSNVPGMITKMESFFEDLMKVDPANQNAHVRMEPSEALDHIRAAVKAGHIHPDVERSMTRHIYEDKMVQGVGNRYAFDTHRAKNRPGVWVQADFNSFKTINDTQGHDAGDDAIRAGFGAMRDAAQKVGTGKLFRQGGDEGAYWAPSHEAAAAFVRHSQANMDKLAPIGGTHKLSSSFGLGLDVATADKALYEAKKQKFHAETGTKRFAPEATPHMAHSLVPGFEGPIPAHDAGAAAVQDVLGQEKKPEAPKAATA